MTLVAVTKTVPVERIRAAVAAGFTVLGENRVQEAAAKITALRAEGGAVHASPEELVAGAVNSSPEAVSVGASDPGRGGSAPSIGASGPERDESGPNVVEPGAEAARHGPGRPVTWHLIGPLQSNKARRAVELFDVIETVDSLALGARLDRLAAEHARADLPVLLEVNVDADPGKSGYAPDAITADLPALANLPRLRLLGLMTVGRLVAEPEEARPTFRRLRELSERLRATEPRLGAALSMGMSDDFEVAVEEGATIVRLGRAIFGARPPA